ncbi:SpdD protein [Streptomyces sp. NPDC020719]|uniref:SpdD protein n=1 Tax=Streptomyces sp. NPDC020719 TaxID=3154896 RepID=UPI00340DAF9E
MFRPKYPAAPPLPVTRAVDSPAPGCGCHSVQYPAPSSLPAARQFSGGTGLAVALVVGGVVLTALLAAVAVAAISVAVAAVVLRSLLKPPRR